jgi:diaminohydroxyphosphoribosylaminopyrimidine deaminase/5-amino-6-(5-phosphoribosylamino)uracil reductase
VHVQEDIEKHEHYMRRCLQLASQGIGRVAPNPMVGSVIVFQDKIIGEGFHTAFGKPHAEVEAIRSVKDPSLLSQSTLFVNLEPCAHFGKTPPCAEAIIKEKIPRVVIATRDPFEKVSGKGVELLRKNGVEVVEHILEEEALFLNRRFITFHTQQRPYIVLKWAESADGFSDISRKNEKGVFWISSPATKKIVHQWRSEESAILVGTRTALNDNPSLTVREVDGKNPMRIVIDRKNVIPLNSSIFNNEAPTWILNDSKSEVSGNIEWKRIEFSEQLLEHLMALLYENKIMSLMIEGGAETLQRFIDKGLWDEARIIQSKVEMNEGLKAPLISNAPAFREKSDTDIIQTIYRV